MLISSVGDCFSKQFGDKCQNIRGHICMYFYNRTFHKLILIHLIVEKRSIYEQFGLLLLLVVLAKIL